MNIPGTRAKNKIMFDKKTRDSKIKRVSGDGASGHIAPGAKKRPQYRAPLFLLLFLGGYRDGAPDCDHHLNKQ